MTVELDPLDEFALVTLSRPDVPGRPEPWN